jgi:hypothetical protein
MLTIASNQSLNEPLTQGTTRKLPEELLRAYSDLHGKPGSDMEAAGTARLWAALEGTETDSAKGFIDYLREEWLKTSLQALRDDLDFFRRLANNLEAEQWEPREDTAHYCAIMAYIWLYEDPKVEPEEITKLQVQDLSQRWRAFQRLRRAGKINGPFMDNFGEEQETLLAREIKLLPRTRWQNMWKRPEFRRLKDAKRGRKPKIVD